MKLYGSPASPFVRKVMVCAAETGLAERIEVVMTTVSPVQSSGEVSAANPLGKIPTLLLEDGTALYDSRVITAWLDEASGGRLVPRNERRWRVLRQEAAADGLADAALLARYEQALRPAEFRWTDWEAGQLAKVRRTIAALDAEGLDPNAVTVGAVAVACALDYLDFRFPTVGWRKDHPTLAAFADAFGQRPSMKATAPKG